MSDAYEDMIEEIQTGIDEASRKIEEGRVVDEEREHIRLEYLEKLNNLVHQKLLIVMEQEDDE